MDNCLQKKSAQLLKNRTPRRLLVCIFVFMMILTGAWAVDYTWNGSAVDGLWANAANWTPNGIPGEGDQVTLSGNENITLSGDVTVDFLFIFSGTNSSSLDLAGNKLTVFTRIRLGQDVTGNLVLNNGTVTTAQFDTEDDGSNSLTLNNVSFSVSSRLLLNGNGTTTISGEAGTTNSFNVGSGVTFYEDSAGVITFGSDVTVNSPVTVWNGKIDNDWDNNGNWAFGVPAASSEVIIAATTTSPVLTTATAALSKLTIAAGAKFTLDTGADLQATTITNNGELTIKDGTITATTQTNGDDSTIIYDGVSAPVWNTTGNTYNNLTIKSGSLTLSDDITINKTFTINSDFTNNAEITANGNVTSTRNMTGSGKLTFAGTTAQTFAGGGKQYSDVEIKNNITITGNNTFINLTADNAGGKTIDFGTTSQNVTGSLSLKGSGTGAANLLNLTGSGWELNCTGTADIEYTNIDHSTATTALVAANSTDGGNNVNWNFPGGIYTWTGAVDDDWFTAGNWDKVSIPGLGAEVIIDTTNPAKLNNNVTLSDASYTGKLTINAGAVLDIAGQDLELGSGDFINNGRLRLHGASGQSISAAMSNGSSATSVVEYYGGSSTDFIWNSNQYKNLEIAGGATTATALTVTGTTTIAAGTGNVTLTFAGAVTIADNAEAGNLDITCPVINLTKVTTTGQQTYTGDIHGTTIEIDGDVAITGDVTTTGNQTYNGEITLGSVTTFTAKDGTDYKTVKINDSISGSYSPVFDSDVETNLTSGMSVATSITVKGNLTNKNSGTAVFNDVIAQADVIDQGVWNSAAGKKLIFNGAGDQLFTAGSSTYANIELSKASGDTVTIKGTPTITNLTEDSNAGNIIFDTPVTIQSDTTLATTGSLSFKNATFELSGTKKNITHTNGNTITNGTIDAADITFDTLSLAGNTSLQSTGSSTLNGNVSLSGGTGISLTIDGAAVINCASITTSGNTTFKGGNVTSTNSSSPEINGDLEIGTSAAGITVSIPLTAKGNVTFNGSNTIDSLTATGLAGKTITFEAGKTQTVNGILTLSGTANSTGNRLILKSSAAGSEWTIECRGTNNHAIQNVDIKDSINISDYVLLAATSWDNGHNTKWTFPGMEYEWTGAASSDRTNWDNRDNWSPASVPGKGAVVTIPSGITGNYYPKLISSNNIDIDNGDTAPATASHGTITIEGVLDLDGYNIKAKKILNKGKIKLKGVTGQTITATMENTIDTSIVEYYGGSTTNFIWDGNNNSTDGKQYKNLEITGGATSGDTFSVTGTTKIAAGSGAVNLSATNNTFTGEITLGDTATSTSAGAVTLVATGIAKIADSANAQSLSVTAATIQIKSIETTAGDQTFNGAVVLADNATLTAPAANTIIFASTSPTTGAYTLTTSGAPIQFNGNVNIASLITDAVKINCDLSITTTAGTTFKGNVSEEITPHTLSISGPVTIAPGCTAIITSGNQSYTGGTFAVNNPCTITSGGNITFSNTAKLTATQKLSISAGSTGSINFNGAVGNSGSYFNELEIQQAATTTFTKPVYITKITDEPAGTISFNAGGYLGNDFTHTTAATNITETLNITGNFTAGAVTATGAKITATGTGLITLNGDIAGTSLETTGTSVTINCENIQTSGTQIYNSHVTLGVGTPADRKINGSTLTFNSSINGSKNLELTSTSGTTLKGSIGDTTSPISLTVTGPLTIATDCSGITTSNSQIYKGNVNLNTDSTLTSSGPGGGITFESTSTVSGLNTLTIVAGSNTVAFQGYAGNTENHLHELIITSAASTNFDNAVYIDNLSDASTHTGGIVLKNGGNITTIGSDAAGTIHTNGTFTIGQAASAAELNLDSNFTHTAGATEIYGTLTAANKNIYLADTSGNPVHINCNNVILSGNFGSTSGNGSATFGTTSVPTNVQLIPTTASSFGNTNDTISITGNLIHSKGTETVKADVTVTKDFLIFGSSYSETDSTTGITNEYAYASARPASWSQIQYTENTLPDGTAISTASSWSAILKVDSGKTITVSKNFYANGTNLSETSASGTWTLKIPNLTTPAAGFAEAYHSSISNCNVSCTSGSAPASTNGTLARLVALECTNGGSNTNVDFDPFVISSAYTVRDNAIRINFNRPVRFHSTTLDNLKFHDSSNSANGTFNGFFSNPDCTSQLNIGDTFPSEVISGTTYYYCYIKAAPQDSATTGAWNTDATGKSAGATDNKSSDRSGVHHSTKPCLDFPRALSGQPFILTDIWGKRLNNYSGRPSASATEPAYGSTSSTHNVADKTGPVLWTVRTGQELHDSYDTATGEASQHSYDSHNFLEFRYSEPVDIGSGAGTIAAYSTGTNPNVVENVQVTDTLGAISENITSSATTLTFAGLAKITAASGSSLQLYTGSNGSANKYVNALYRQDEYSIRLSIAGWTDGTVTDYAGNSYKKWPGYIESASQFTDATAKAVASTNTLVTDQAGNHQIEYAAGSRTEPTILSDSSGSHTAALLPTTPADTYSPWELSSPVFTPLRFSRETDWGDQAMSEAIGNTNGSGSTLDRIDFHFFDNTPTYSLSGTDADEAVWYSQIGWCNTTGEASKANLFDNTYTYCADIVGGARQFYTDASCRTTGGIRFSTKADIASTFTSAFKYSTNINNPSPSNSFQNGIAYMYTTVVSQLFTGSSNPMRPANDPDGLYMGLGLTDSNLSVDTTFSFSYSESLGYLTDLAGNRLRSKISKTIDRTPPSFDVIISPIDTKSIYILFVKQIVTDSTKIRYRLNYATTDTPITVDFDTLIPRCFRIISIDSSGQPVLSTENQIDTSTPAQIVENFSNESFTCIKLTTTKEINIDNLKNLYIQLINHPDYEEQSSDPLTNNIDCRVTFIQDYLGNYMSMYSAHALSDFAVNYVNPLYAYSTDMLYEDQSIMNGLYEAGSWAVHDWNADQQNYGTLPAGYPISIVADTKGDEKIRVYLSPSPDADSVSKQFNSDFDAKFRIWLPALQDSLFRALSAANNTNFVYSDGQLLDASSANSLFNITKETVSSWQSGSQISFMFGLMQNSNSPVRIYNNPYYDVSTDKFNLSLSIPVPLYCLRMTDTADLNTLDLWSFKIKGITAQRGGVTILNNVINASNDEKAVVIVDMPEDGNLTVCVMTLDGNIITYLNRGNTKSGEYYYTWNGKNKNGKSVARGMYFVRVLGGGIDETRKVMVIK